MSDYISNSLATQVINSTDVYAMESIRRFSGEAIGQRDGWRGGVDGQSLGTDLKVVAQRKTQEEGLSSVGYSGPRLKTAIFCSSVENSITLYLAIVLFRRTINDHFQPRPGTTERAYPFRQGLSLNGGLD